MTKAELLKALEPFGDNQFVYVRLHSRDYPDGAQIGIEGVEAVAPWVNTAPGELDYLVGLNVDAENSEVRILEARAKRRQRFSVMPLQATEDEAKAALSPKIDDGMVKATSAYSLSCQTQPLGSSHVHFVLTGYTTINYNGTSSKVTVNNDGHIAAIEVMHGNPEIADGRVLTDVKVDEAGQITGIRVADGKPVSVDPVQSHLLTADEPKPIKFREFL